MTRDEVIHQAAEESKDHRGHIVLWLCGALLMIGVLALAAVVFIGRAQNDHLAGQVDALTHRAETAEQATGQLADQVRKLGAVPVVSPPQPSTTADPAVLRATVRTEVENYCAARNGCRGPDGVSPNLDVIVNQVLAKVPAPKDGRDGRDAPTPDWQAQVAAYCGQAGEPCRGKPGVDGQNGHDGAPGVSITRQYFDRDSSGQCRNYNDFSDGRTRVDEGQAGDVACAPSSPPTQTTPAILPPGTTKRRRYT